MNSFYLFKGQMQTALKGSINTTTGEEVASSTTGQYYCPRISKVRPDGRPSLFVFAVPAPDVNFKIARTFYYDKDSKYLGYAASSNINGLVDLDEYTGNIYSKVSYVAFDFQIDITETELSQMAADEITNMLTRVWFYTGFALQDPHYSKLEKKCKKETSQVFFRDTLEGTVKIFGTDFDFIKNQALETKYLFVATDENKKVLVTNSFVKPDCKLDYMKHCIQLKLSAIDKYSKIVDKYDNTYDLIKLAPAITPLTLTKRLLYQFYIQGADSVSCYANGTYWEQDVSDSVDDIDALKNKYYFGQNAALQEIFISPESGSSYPGTYVHEAGTPATSWVNSEDSSIIIEGTSDTSYATAWGYKWFKTGEAYTGQGAPPDDNVFMLKVYKKVSGIQRLVEYSADRYIMEGWQDNVDTVTMNPAAKYTFNIDTAGTKQYDLGIINYTIWARVLADVDTVIWGGETRTLYDLPADDFVAERVNYRKCIGLIGLNIQQTTGTVSHPTKFGRTDYGDYFTSNTVHSYSSSHLPVPISRSTWANTSIWAIIPDTWSTFEAVFRSTFTLKDAYALSDVIKALLHKINPLIKFEATSEYSQFLYGSVASIFYDSERTGCVPFIAPKSNVLKGNYDQAAQKAEITFEQVMNMLRDCFRCYWYIDDNSRLRIEHIFYFMNGLSYSSPDVQLDLTAKYDKFNKKTVLYSQEEISYSKDGLCSRYEFSWMDDSTDTFDDMEIDISSVYIQSDKTEEITSEVFSTDVDLMLYAPDMFSEDGFALMLADKSTNKVPITRVANLRDDEYFYPYEATPQNYLCSWLYLARYYMKDMPATSITYTRAPQEMQLSVRGVKQCMQQDVEFQTTENVDLYKAVKTSIGTGIIDSMSMNLDTKLISATLNFSPK